MNCTNLDDYFLKYGHLIAEKSRTAFEPLHTPGKDQPIHLRLKRDLFEPQAHAVSALTKAWQRQKSLILCAECGTGKTIMGIAAVHAAAEGRPYRAVAFSPPTLVEKWKREIDGTLPNVRCEIVGNWADMLDLPFTRPTGAEWLVLGQSTAKNLSGWRAAFIRDRHGRMRCPKCNERLVRKFSEDGDSTYWTEKELARTKRKCRDCGEPLWQYCRQWNRWSPAKYLQTKGGTPIDYLIIDEAHEEKGETSLQGLAAGSLLTVSRRALGLTGTLIGGYANHLRPLLFRMAPSGLAAEGLGWKDATEFNRRYGRIETIVTEREGREETTRNGRGSTKPSKREAVKPGIVPTLYSKHLMGNTVFLALEEVAANLPMLMDSPEYGCGPVPIEMDAEQRSAYDKVEADMKEAMTEMMRRGNRKLLGPFLNTLLGYPDHPFDYGEIGYYDQSPDGEKWVHVTTPAALDRATRRPKEKKLLEIVRAERRAGRACWVFVEMTKKRSVLNRLERMFADAGLRVKVLDNVPTKDREAWIARNAPGVDVMLSHPKKVSTGLDFFGDGPAGSYNFPNLIFYETGYQLFTLRQASRRAWRIGQTQQCKLFYLYYADSMQERAMALMGKKLSAAMALEGQFSSEGLAAICAEGDTEEMELARSLSERLDFQVDRNWAKLGAGQSLDELWAMFEDLEDVPQSNTMADEAAAWAEFDAMLEELEVA